MSLRTRADESYKKWHRQVMTNRPSLNQFNSIRSKTNNFFARDGPLRKDYSNILDFTKEATILFIYIFGGWNDATAGSILPAIQARYGLTFSIVSLLFVSNLVGVIFAACITPELLKRLTFGRLISVACSIAIIPSVAISAGSPFAVMATVYAFFGFSIGSLNAICNAWISARPQARVRLSCLHFAYGIGALSAPLAGSPFVVKGYDFHKFYLATLGLCLANTILATAIFKFRKEGYPQQEQQQQQPSIELQELQNDSNPSNQSSSLSQWKRLLHQRDTHIFAFYSLFYVGTEVSIGGWTSTYIIQVRGDVDASGHIISGFWGGLAAGRILLIPITNWLGPQRAALGYLLLSIALQLIVWLVPQVIATAVAVAMMGFFFGPIYPILVELISQRIIPRSIQTFAIAYIMTFGSAGSALFPLIVGLILQKAGAQALAPVLLSFLVAQIIIFSLLGIPKRSQVAEANRGLD